MRKKLLILGVILLFLTCVFTPYTATIHAKKTNISWESTLYFNETSGKTDYVVFGEAADARDGSPADSYDVAKPPTPMIPYIRAYFRDNLPSPYNSLWKDYRFYPDTYKVWNVTVIWAPEDDESPTTVIISWNPTIVDTSEYSAVNFCTNAGVVLKNMLIESSYTFTSPANIPQSFKIICTRDNTSPETPSIPTGETNGYHGASYTYSTSSIDADGDDLYYQFDWSNTLLSSWLGPYHSGEVIQTSFIWNTPGSYQIKAITKDIYGAQSSWSSALPVEMMNRAPSQPSAPTPQNSATNIPINPSLSWTATDPDGDTLTSDVYFGTMNPPLKIVDNQSDSSFHPGTLQYQTTYYWKIISWDGFGGSTSSPVWSFATIASDDGSSPNDDTNETNTPPRANISQSEQTGFVGTSLVFNGSRSYDPDGYLTKWYWDFGDGTNGSGEITSHTYLNVGMYTVTLTVTDNKGATGTDTSIVQIMTANRPPTKPVINGTRTGTKNETYTYTVLSTDPENDFLQYIITWGDETQNTSVFLPNGTVYSLPHAWGSPGKYMITATATDNTTLSEQATFPVFIDVYFIGELGFLFDANNDGLNDSFYTNTTGLVTSAQMLTNGSYLLDTDTDGKWNYLYNPSLGSLSIMTSIETTSENQLFFVGIIALAIIVIACIVYFYKKNYF
jgi:chitodextrinase